MGGSLIVSHARKFIFIHNPKCAGTSFRAAIESYHDHETQFWGVGYEPYFQREVDYAHLRLWELAAIHPELLEQLRSYNSVVFVRNPFQRFVSAISEHFKQYRPEIVFSTLSASEQLRIVENFVVNNLTSPRIHADFRYVHFSPQSWFFAMGGAPRIRHILPVLADGESVQQGLECLGVPARLPRPRNINQTGVSALLRSDIIRSFVTNVYSQDFEFIESSAALRVLNSQSPTGARAFVTNQPTRCGPPATKKCTPRQRLSSSFRRLRHALGV